MPESALPAAFLSTLQSLVDWLEAQQVPYVAIGGVAVSLLAQPRATQDIDALIWLEESRWETFLQAGDTYGFASRISGPLEFAGRARVLLLRDQTSGISIDISCGALEFEREMIERSTALTIGALNLKVPTPEDLIITKAVAQRQKDIADIEAIIMIYPNLDLARIRNWTREFATALEMPELLENLEKLLQRIEHKK
ncbi:MAG TPA: nucleotidyltransferase [Pyrinomonadaceae bacterium]|jgi:hypothetical protein|nr:nucleotidyltransferase [Pyrinomonadaceae bacterium]